MCTCLYFRDNFDLFDVIKINYVLLLQNRNTWARLFKTNDVLSERFVKILNVNISNKPIFFVEKM